MVRVTSEIIDSIYPIVEKSLDTNKRKLLTHIGNFLNSKHDEIYEIAPYTRIIYNKNNSDDLFRSLNINENEILSILQRCFFWDMNFNPPCIKEPYVPVLMCCIRYFMKHNDRKTAELVTIYTLFTGKFYASIHYKMWKYPPNKQILDYVVNNMLSDKFDLKKEGTIFGAIKKLAMTWLDKYKSVILARDLDDDDLAKKLVQQLRDRENSFLKNIMILYKEAYDNKLYLNYETDSLDPDEFRITSNDATVAAKITEATISVMTSQKVSLKICKAATATTSIKPEYLMDIMEGILSDNKNLPKLRRVINIIICDFMANYPVKGDKRPRVGGPDFIKYTMKAKPNTKSDLLIELKQTIVTWLNENSERYRNTKRQDTLNNYYRATLFYITLMICNVSESM